MVEAALLHFDAEDKLCMTINDVIGGRGMVLGSPGRGKTTFLARYAEQTAPYTPMTIVDPFSAFWTLGQKSQFIIVGRSEHSLFEVTPDQAARLAEISYNERISVILDLLLFSEEEADALVAAYFGALWRLGVIAKQPYLILVEEAHRFLPESSANTPARNIMKEFATAGRQFGFGMMFATQSASQISKRIMRACELLVLFGINANADLKIYQAELSLEPAETKRLAYDLEVGDAIIRYRKFTGVVHMLNRETFHVGMTPSLNGDSVPTLGLIDQALIDRLRGVLDVAPDVDDGRVALQQRIAQLEAELASGSRLTDQEKNILAQVEDTLGDALADVKNIVNRLQMPSPPIEFGYRAAQEMVIDRIAATMGVEETFFHISPDAQVTFPPNYGSVAPSVLPIPASLEITLAALSSYDRSILDTLCAHYPMWLPHSKVATYSGKGKHSSSFSAGLRTLKASGLIVENGAKEVQINSMGLWALGKTATLPATPEGRRDLWLVVLPSVEACILKVLIETYPNLLDVRQISDLTTYSMTSSSFSDALRVLRRHDLVKKDGLLYMASQSLIG